VIIHAFEEWGIDFLHRLRGMFAIALWDNEKKELWLIRDRIGVKPLYYSNFNDRLVFASEIKAILKDPEQKREVNEEGLFHYLSFLTVPAPETLFGGIYKLPAGSYMKVSADGSSQSVKYYDILDHTKDLSNLTEDQITGKIMSELRTSVQYRKVSDVPVGVFLSGGIDSSTNAALFSEDNKGIVKTFSIGYDGEYSSYKSELEYAKLLADQVSAVYHEKLLSMQDLNNFLPLMVDLQDEPLADPVCVPVYYVSKLARENGVIVCQVGEGADELFFGYPGWKRILKVYQLNALPIPNILKKVFGSVMKLAGLKTHGYMEYVRRAIAKQPLFWSGAEAFTHEQKLQIISKRLKKKFKGKSSYSVIEPIWKNYSVKAQSNDAINWMAYMDLNLRLPELLLMRVDKMSMGVSLEARVPFLDHKFVELAMSIPGQMKFKDDILKYLLKKSVRGIIPDEIIDRKKQGFAAPIADWYEDALGEKAFLILQQFCKETDFLDWHSVEKLLQSKAKSHTWPLLNLAIWWNHYIKQAIN
jgi:asparagine synthase (glutamine-hydrolysing)